MASIAAVSRSTPGRVERSSWSAVYAMSLCSFVLIASEFLPVSLLSPIAAELHLTAGQAGQVISVSGVFALVTSLSVTILAGRLDRKHVLLGLTVLLMVSGLMVSLAPDYAVLMVGRAVLGCAIGGFWSMSAATAMRLVPAASVMAAMAVINGGNAIAMTIAAPLGSYAGGLIGWRGAFFCVVPIAAASLVWLWLSLPRLPAPERRTPGYGGMGELLRRPLLASGLLAVALLFAGQFAMFTYLRPFLEQVTRVNLWTISSLLLVIGVSGLVGTAVVGRIAAGHLKFTLAALPMIMAAVAAALSVYGGSLYAASALLAIWGLTATAAPVPWWSWLARIAPDAAESAGGLMVAVVQLAITLGATLGGLAFDAFGPATEFLAAGGILLMASLVTIFGVATQVENSTQHQGECRSTRH